MISRGPFWLVSSVLALVSATGLAEVRRAQRRRHRASLPKDSCCRISPCRRGHHRHWPARTSAYSGTHRVLGAGIGGALFFEPRAAQTLTNISIAAGTPASRLSAARAAHLQARFARAARSRPSAAAPGRALSTAHHRCPASRSLAPGASIRRSIAGRLDCWRPRCVQRLPRIAHADAAESLNADRLHPHWACAFEGHGHWPRPARGRDTLSAPPSTARRLAVPFVLDEAAADGCSRCTVPASQDSPVARRARLASPWSR